jgi:hypothetical protein
MHGGSHHETIRRRVSGRQSTSTLSTKAGARAGCEAVKNAAKDATIVEV